MLACRQVLDSLDDAVLVADRAGVVAYANPAAERLLGYAAGGLAGVALAEVLPGAGSGGSPLRLEARPRTGPAHEVEATRCAIGAGDDELGAFVLREPRSHAEQAAARMAQLPEALPQIVWRTDAAGRVLYVNGRWREYTGSDAPESFREAVHPADRGALDAAWARSLATREPFEESYRLRRHDGTYRWHLGRGIPLDEAGREWLGTATDIDLERRAATTTRILADAGVLLAASLEIEPTLERLALMVVPHLGDWCAVLLQLPGDPEARQVAVAHVDPAKVAWARELGERYPPDRSAPQGAFHVLRTGKAELYPTIPWDALRTLARDEEHWRIIESLGMVSGLTVPLTARGRTFGALTLVSAESGRRYDEGDLALAQAIADRAALGVDNARLLAEARAAVRLRDDFLQVASHELRTPLTPLTLHVEGLQRALGPGGEHALSGPKVVEKLATVARQVDRLEKLVHSLLDVSRLQRGRIELEPHPLDLAAVVRDLGARFEPEAARAGCPLRVRAEAPILGSWDPTRLDQVISNLLSNAIKFGHGAPIEIAVEERDGVGVLTVRDHGIGVPVEAQRRIFERYERAVATRNYGGFGLGLWIARELVQAMGGSITVRSADGAGATFEVRLPLAAPGEEAAPVGAT